MSVMFVLIGFSLLVALIFLGLFIWAVKSGQFDDKYTPSVRMLFDDEKPVEETSTSDIQANRSTE
jgi:cbb3-type cytochrome oxidase maturation protein